MKYNYDGVDHIQEYSGVPNVENILERTLIAKFVESLVQNLTEELKNQGKINIISGLLTAETEFRNALAQKETAHAELLKANALKVMQDIAEQAVRMEQEKLKKAPITGSPADLVEDFNALQEKLELMRIKYGLNLSIDLIP